MTRITYKDVEKAAATVNLQVMACSPGDSITRYTIGRRGANGGFCDLYHALGSTEAMAYIRGFQDAKGGKP